VRQARSGRREGLKRTVKTYKPVIVIVSVIVAVAEPVIVAVHVHVNATVGVIERVQAGR
jgi:hypothetical protein